MALSWLLAKIVTRYWLITNKVILEVITFSTEWVSKRDLGVIIDSKLYFNSHINCGVSKAEAAPAFVIRFCYDVEDYGTKKSLFYALLQSLLDYCCVVWLPFYKIHKEKNELMYALRENPSAANNFKISPINEWLCKLDMLCMSLQRRRLNSVVLYLVKLFMYVWSHPQQHTLSWAQKNLNRRKRESS